MFVLLACFVAFIAGIVGWAAGATFSTKETLRSYGFTRNSAKLYDQAIKILNRLVRVTDLDGAFAADILSPETRKDIESLLDAYRKELNR